MVVAATRPVVALAEKMLKLQLLNGDWSVVEDAAIRFEWLRYYEMRGEMLIPLDINGKAIDSHDCRSAQRFATIDTRHVLGGSRLGRR